MVVVVGSMGLALPLLRSETVKVYVNNEINILVYFFLSPLRFLPYAFKMCFGLKVGFVNLGMSFLFFSFLNF